MARNRHPKAHANNPTQWIFQQQQQHNGTIACSIIVANDDDDHADDLIS